MKVRKISEMRFADDLKTPNVVVEVPFKNEFVFNLNLAGLNLIELKETKTIEWRQSWDSVKTKLKLYDGRTEIWWRHMTWQWK